MKTVTLLLALSAFMTTLAVAEPPTAEQVLAKAKKQAVAEHKAIYVHFGASWCGWCRRLDAFLDRGDIKPVFEKYFVPVKLVVQENEKNKALENAGAEALLKQWGGPAGLPYAVFLDGQGVLIVNSKRPSGPTGEGENIGYPATPREVAWFLHMMKQAAPKMAEADLKKIEQALRTPTLDDRR